MSEEARATAYRQMIRAQHRWHATLDAMLIPPSDAPADQVREDWEPIEQFITEGPDVGETDFPESEAGQRIN
jgi:hypothetical protein